MTYQVSLHVVLLAPDAEIRAFKKDIQLSFAPTRGLKLYVGLYDQDDPYSVVEFVCKTLAYSLLTNDFEAIQEEHLHDAKEVKELVEMWTRIGFAEYSTDLPAVKRRPPPKQQGEEWTVLVPPSFPENG